MLMDDEQAYLLDFDNKDDAGIFATAISTMCNTGESIARVTVTVKFWNVLTKKYVSAGVSKVEIWMFNKSGAKNWLIEFQVTLYHDSINNTGRLEATKLEDNEVNKMKNDEKRIKQ